jgi:hypothetical protein
VELVGEASLVRRLLQWRVMVTFDEMVLRTVRHGMDELAQMASSAAEP